MASKVEQTITRAFLAKVEESNYLPWQKPWELRENINFVSKHEYTGINRLMTSLSDFGCPYWLSYKKATELGGQVKAGSKSTKIIFLGSGENKETEKSYSFLRYYSVFNLEQTTLEIPEKEENKTKLIEIDSFLKSSRLPKINHGGSRASYLPSQDVVTVPYLSQYSSDVEFYSTLFHELVHSTGHHTRLDRSEIVNPANMTSDSYSFEELVAEIGAALLCSKTGKFSKTAEQNSIAYVRIWKSRLSNNQDWLIRAASKAEKAVSYLLKEEN